MRNEKQEAIPVVLRILLGFVKEISTSDFFRFLNSIWGCVSITEFRVMHGLSRLIIGQNQPTDFYQNTELLSARLL